MHYLPLDIQHKLAVLEAALYALHREVSVYENGIKEELKETELLFSYVHSLQEAVEFLKHSDAMISLDEYKKILIDLGKADVIIKKKKGAVKDMETVLKTKKKEAAVIKRNIEALMSEGKRGVVLPFKKDE